jgi:hypothetical protein
MFWAVIILVVVRKKTDFSRKSPQTLGATLPHHVRIFLQDIVPPAGQRSRDFHKLGARSGEAGVVERTQLFAYK